MEQCIHAPIMRANLRRRPGPAPELTQGAAIRHSSGGYVQTPLLSGAAALQKASLSHMASLADACSSSLAINLSIVAMVLPANF